MLTGLAYTLKKQFAFVTGRFISGLTGLAIGTGFGFDVGALPFFAIPIGTLVMGGLARMDYNHRANELLRFYRDEVGAKLGKDPRFVGMSDLKMVAAGDPATGLESNNTLKQALDLNKKRFWFDVGIGLASAAVTVGILAVAGGILGTGLALSAGALSLNMLTHFALNAIGKQALGLNNTGVHDRIRSLQKSFARDDVVSQEQVFDVYVAANKGLATQIENHFRKSYDQMGPQEMHQAFAMFGKEMGVEAMTADINNRQVKLAELGFAAQGQASGVARLAEPPFSYSGYAQSLIDQGVERGREGLNYVGDQAKMSFQKAKTYYSAAAERVQEKAKSWGERVGGSKGQDGSYTEQEMNRRALASGQAPAIG